MTIGEDGCLRTNDMALATVVIMNGYNPKMSKVDGEVEFLVHLDAEEASDMRELLDEYMQGECLVEPKRFVRELAGVRKDVYRLMNHSQQSRGTKLRR